MTQKVEHHPELSRDEYSKAVTNIDNDAYTKYMLGATARKQRNTTLMSNTEEINNLKEDMSEIKDMLRQIISQQNGN